MTIKTAITGRREEGKLGKGIEEVVMRNLKERERDYFLYKLKVNDHRRRNSSLEIKTYGRSVIIKTAF